VSNYEIPKNSQSDTCQRQSGSDYRGKRFDFRQSQRFKCAHGGLVAAATNASLTYAVCSYAESYGALFQATLEAPP